MEVTFQIPYQVGVNQENNVLIDFGMSTRFVVLEPKEAIQLAEWLIKHAKTALGQKDN